VPILLILSQNIRRMRSYATPAVGFPQRAAQKFPAGVPGGILLNKEDGTLMYLGVDYRILYFIYRLDQKNNRPGIVAGSRKPEPEKMSARVTGILGAAPAAGARRGASFPTKSSCKPVMSGAARPRAIPR